MKLRSIVTAGLLGASLLTVTGCWLEDEVKDKIEEALKTNVINLANGRTSQVEFTIDEDSEFVGSETSKMVVVTGHDTYTVNNTEVDDEAIFVKDKAHLYALCVDDNVLTDTSTTGAREIEVMNLSGTPIDAGSGKSVTVTLYDASGTNIASASLAGETRAACSREVLDLPDFALSAVKTVEVNDVNYTVPSYDAEIAEKLDQLNDVDFDIVVFNPATEKGTIVPLATAVELAID